jgi:hypothetical protein
MHIPTTSSKATNRRILQRPIIKDSSVSMHAPKQTQKVASDEEMQTDEEDEENDSDYKPPEGGDTDDEDDDDSIQDVSFVDESVNNVENENVNNIEDDMMSESNEASFRNTEENSDWNEEGRNPLTFIPSSQTSSDVDLDMVDGTETSQNRSGRNLRNRYIPL